MDTRIELEMKIADPITAKTAHVMAGMGLGIEGIFEKQTISFSTSSEVTEDYLAKLKKHVKEGFEKDGYKVYEIITKVIH